MTAVRKLPFWVQRLVVCAALGGVVGCATSGPGQAPERVESAIVSTEAWSFEQSPGAIVRTEHYRIFTTEDNTGVVNRLAQLSEAALMHYRGALGALPAPEQRLDTYLMANRSQWVSLTRRLMGEQGEGLTKIARGGYATRGIGVYWNLGVYDTLAIAAHEGWHQYTQRVFKNRLPTSLEEGIATYMEGHGWDGGRVIFKPWANLERYERLRSDAGAEAGGRLMALEELLTVRPTDMLGQPGDPELTYYAQVWALIHFLREGSDGAYRGAFEAIVRDAAEGKLVQRVVEGAGRRRAGAELGRGIGLAVLEVYLGGEFEVIEREYRAFVETVVAEGARDRVAVGRSPIGE